MNMINGFTKFTWKVDCSPQTDNPSHFWGSTVRSGHQWSEGHDCAVVACESDSRQSIQRINVSYLHGSSIRTVEAGQTSVLNGSVGIDEPLCILSRDLHVIGSTELRLVHRILVVQVTLMFKSSIGSAEESWWAIYDWAGACIRECTIKARWADR